MDEGISLGLVMALVEEATGADPAVIEQAVQDWLEEHPEATTTVADGSITEQKLAAAVAAKINQVSQLSDEIDDIGSDVTDLKSAFNGYVYGVNQTFTHTGSTGWDYFRCLLLEGVEYTITNNNADHAMQARIYREDDSHIEIGTAPAGGTLKFIAPSDEFVRVGGYMFNNASFTITNEYSNLNAAQDVYDELSNEIENLKGYFPVSYSTTHGKSIGVADGLEYNVSDYEATDFIPVSPGQVYEVTAVLGGSSLANATGFCGYDENEDFSASLVSVFIVNGHWGSTRQLINKYQFIIPDGVAFIKGCNAYKGSLNTTLELKQVNTDSTQYKVEEITDKLDTLDEEKTALVEISEYNSYVSGYDPSPISKKALFTIGACSDIHGASKQWKQFVLDGNKNAEYIDCSVFLGDLAGANPNSDISFYVPSDSNIPLISVIGNHDVGQNGNVGIDTETAFSRYIMPLVDSGFISTDTPYYYKDFASYKIRMIILYEYEGAENTTAATTDNFYRYMKSSQLQWFADALYSTPNDYSVIVCLHQIVYYAPVILDNIFTETKIYRKVNDAFNGGVGYLFNKMSGDCIGDIVNAYQTGTAISKSYTATIGGVTQTSEVSKDFSGRGIGKFLCYLGGHSHAPFVVRNGNYLNQLQILLPSASDSPYQRGNDDIRPMPEIPNYYYIGFDSENMIVKIYKRGYHITQGMINRNYTVVPCAAG